MKKAWAGFSTQGKGIGYGLLVFAALIVLATLLHAQTATVSPPPDSIVQVTAEAQGLEPVASADLPSGGTFWLVTSNGITAPSPCPPNNLSDFPVYAMADGIYLVDETGGQVMTNEENSTIESALAAQADAVTGLINQIQDAQLSQDIAMAFGLDMEMDSSSSFSPMFAVADPTALWLEITNVSNGWSYFNLHNATNFVYAILSKTDLTAATWNIETELFPTLDQTNVMPFAVQNLDRQTLFVKAMDWTGIDSDSDGIPDWWAWQYWGSVNVTDTNLDYSGNNNTFAQDYSNNIVPTVFSFTGLKVTNNYVNSMSAPVQLAVTGSPYYLAVSVDDTNYAAEAVWNTYTSSNVTVTLGFTQGWHDVRIGLRGHADDTNSAVWQWKRLNLDYTPPQLTITNPVSGTVSVPVVQLQGFANEDLSSLMFDVSNATGVVTGQPGYWQPVFYDTNSLTFTTNSFQCYDIPLTNGANTIAVHATDLAGNTTTTNITLTLDYSGDYTAPVVSVVWPPDGTSIVDTNFTLQATVDDATATITAAIMDGSGDTNTVTALVQRDGTVWAQNLPLATGTNTLTIIATDAAGNASTNSLSLYQSGVLVTVDSLTQLNQASVTVTGTISDPSYDVSVNGTNAYYVDDVGDWEADGVLVSPSGAAILDVEVSGAGSGGMSIRALGGGLFRTDDLSSETTGGSKQVVVPQPPTVEETAYESVLNGSSTYIGWCGEPTVVNTGNEHWVAGVGGHLHTYRTDWNGNCGDPVIPETYDADLSADTSDLPLAWEYAEVAQTGDGYWATLHTRTQITLEPTKAAGTAGIKNYLVRASAMAFSNPGPAYQFYGEWWYAPDVPLPPEWLLVNGQTVINDGITNADGTIEGVVLITAPAGDNVPLTVATTSAHPNQDYTFNATVAEIYPPFVDADRDGQITFDAKDQTSATNYYRFWVNNDHDGYDSSISDYADLDPSTGSDANNTSITSTRDLEDYTRLWINTQGLTADLQNGNLLLALEWTNVVNDPQIRIFQAVEPNGGSLYLTDLATAQAQTNAPYGNCLVDSSSSQNKVSKSAPFFISTNFWADANITTNQPVAHLLFDAVGRGSGKLVVAIYKKDGVTKLAEGEPLYLKLQDVKEMYDRYTVGDGNAGAVATTASLVTSPYYYDSTMTAENNYILFVHGWNLAPWEKDAFAETAFKRLYWQGYKGHFGAFQWPTGYGISDTLDAVLHARNYDNSESNAWASATGLLNKLNNLDAVYSHDHVYLMAHSMGNVVAGEALNLASSQAVKTYIACQAAISAHGYDPNTSVWTTSGSTPDVYAHYWTNDAPCYFNGSAGAGNYVNFYNTNDYALDKWTSDQYWKPNKGLGGLGINYPGYFSDTPSSTHPSGFYKIVGSTVPDTDLFFPTNNYEVLAYCVQSQSYALGATASVGGVFDDSQIDLGAEPFNYNTAHKYHSAEFLSDNMNRAIFWNTLLKQIGL